MATTLEYIVSLQDKISSKIGKITITSDRMLDKFADLEKKTSSVNRTFNETGRTMGSLREKIALLQAEREWIPAENINGIRAYNREIKKLTKEVTKLESLDGSKFKKWSREAFAAMPGAGLIANPLVAGAAAIGFAGKSAMSFDEGMAKVNITAQLDEKGLDDLKEKLRKMVEDNKADISIAPVGLEKIISQVGDLDLSMQILDASLKGSKAGFTDMDTVSGALAQSLSVIGKENTNAKEVLDTFFAAKRVGAGEFVDFARYMPGLIAGASSMGINFKEVAGTFAYMTGKGQSAERAAVLMQNAFSVLARSDVRGKMEKAGIKVFDDQGKMRGMVDIFKDMSGVLGGMTDEQKSSILEKFGLVDKEAKNAFALMTSDLGKLQDAMDATANAAGETEKALGFSENTIQKATELWNQFKGIVDRLGIVILPLISAGLDALSLALSGVSKLISGVMKAFAWWEDKLMEGNPYVWGLTAAVSALSVALLVNRIRVNAAMIALKSLVVWDAIVAGATAVWTAAQWLLNGAFLACPLTWIVVGIGAVVGAVAYCWNEFEGFRKVVLGCWEVLKEFGRTLVDAVVTPFKQVLSGIGKVGAALVSLLKGDFGAFKETAAQGLEDIASGTYKLSPMVVTANVVRSGNWGDAWEKGKQAGAESWQASQAEKNKPEAADTPKPDAPKPPAVTAAAKRYEELLKSMGGGKQKTGSGVQPAQVLNLNEGTTVQNLQPSAEYTAAIRKLAPQKVDLAPVRTALLANVSNVSEKLPEASSSKPAEGRKSMEDAGQDYEPEKSEKSELLKDIMLNVCKIAAIGAIPLAVNLSAPAPMAAKVPPSPTLQLPEPASVATPSSEVYNFESSEKTTERDYFRSEKTTERDNGKKIYLDRFCDQLVIHVRNTDGKGQEDIRKEVINTLNQLFEV